MIHSMTGFARQRVVTEWGTLQCEMRSVNHRYLELSVRLPDVLRDIDPAVRQLCKHSLARGKVDCTLHFEPHAATENLQLNHELAQQLLAAEHTLAQQYAVPIGLNAATLLRWPGMLATAEVDQDQIQNVCLKLIEQVVQQLVAARQQEGEQIAQILLDKLTAITACTQQVQERLPVIQARYQQKLTQRFTEAQVTLEPDRLAQEMLLLAQKMDVAEELDRLTAHIQTFKTTLQSGAVVGRKLDFLMQEFNREANTLGSKSVDAGTTQAAVDLKVVIEQLREQVQNVQ